MPNGIVDTLSRWLRSILWFSWMTGGWWFRGTDKLLTTQGVWFPSHEKSVSKKKKKSWFLPHPHWESEHETWLWNWKGLSRCSRQLRVILGLRKKPLASLWAVTPPPRGSSASRKHREGFWVGLFWVDCGSPWWSISSNGFSRVWVWQTYLVSYWPQPGASLDQMLDTRI